MTHSTVQDTALPYTIKSDYRLLLIAAIVILAVTIPLPIALSIHHPVQDTILAWIVLGCIWVALGFQVLSAGYEQIILGEEAMYYRRLFQQDEGYYEHIKSIELVYQPHGKGPRSYFIELSGTASVSRPLRISVHNFSSNDLSRLIDAIAQRSLSVTMSPLVQQI